MKSHWNAQFLAKLKFQRLKWNQYFHFLITENAYLIMTNSFRLHLIPLMYTVSHVHVWIRKVSHGQVPESVMTQWEDCKVINMANDVKRILVEKIWLNVWLRTNYNVLDSGKAGSSFLWLVKFGDRNQAVICAVQQEHLTKQKWNNGWIINEGGGIYEKENDGFGWKWRNGGYTKIAAPLTAGGR